MSEQAVLVDVLWQEVQRQLEKEKQRIFDEIVNYPPPIPACDVQFNFLLAERARITDELRRVRQFNERENHDFSHIRAMRTFIESSDFLDSSLAAKFLAGFESVLDE